MNYKAEMDTSSAKRCQGTAYNAGSFFAGGHQCNSRANPKSKDGMYCLTHCPDRRAEKDRVEGAKRDFAFDERAMKLKRRERMELRACEAVNLIRAIAADAWGPRKLAQDLLAEYADLDKPGE